MWMLPLYLHVNQKSDYDMMIYDGLPKKIFYQVLLKSAQWLQMRSCLKFLGVVFFLFLALVAILCSGAERFEQFW